MTRKPAPAVRLAKSPAAGKEGATSGRGVPQRLSSVAMSVKLLKAFSQSEAELGITSLSQKLGVAKSTVYRLATTFVSEGLLEQNPDTEKYRLGIGLFELGALVRQRMNVAAEARPLLFKLREETDETVHLALLDGIEVIYVLNLESNHAIRMRADLGARKPAYCTAEGRAMLAFKPEASIRQFLDHKFAPRTPKTIVDPVLIGKALERIRKIGFAQEDEQSEVGMRSVAAPIRNADGAVVAAVGLAGPMQRLPDKTMTKFAPLVADAANQISIRLGYRRST